MKNLTVLSVFVLIFSCNTSTHKSKSKEQLTEIVEKEQISIPKPPFQKESLDSIIGTTWIYQPYPEYPNCVDTIRISNKNAFDYHCEMEIEYDIKFRIQDDTLFAELYDYKSEVDAELGMEIKSKCKFIKSGGKLIAVYRTWKYGDNFEPAKPAKPANLYQKYTKL